MFFALLKLNTYQCIVILRMKQHRMNLAFLPPQYVLEDLWVSLQYVIWSSRILTEDFTDVTLEWEDTYWSNWKFIVAETMRNWTRWWTRMWSRRWTMRWTTGLTRICISYLYFCICTCVSSDKSQWSLIVNAVKESDILSHFACGNVCWKGVVFVTFCCKAL